uniref:Uncharacterized protein n=1 Tax=Uncultured archaeon GZfos26G2 TaxID=3386331 RepID=Q649B8_UNCAG|nr:hypothetical protein GZ35B7_42 [uncultured archaeon GZfos35B7]
MYVCFCPLFNHKLFTLSIAGFTNRITSIAMCFTGFFFVLAKFSISLYTSSINHLI